MFVINLHTCYKTRIWKAKIDSLYLTKVSAMLTSGTWIAHEGSRAWTGASLDIDAATNFRLITQAVFGLFLTFCTINFSLTCIFILGAMRNYTAAKKKRIIAFAVCFALLVTMAILGLGATFPQTVWAMLGSLAIFGWFCFIKAYRTLRQQAEEHQVVATKQASNIKHTIEVIAKTCNRAHVVIMWYIASNFAYTVCYFLGQAERDPTLLSVGVGVSLVNIHASLTVIVIILTIFVREITSIKEQRFTEAARQQSMTHIDMSASLSVKEIAAKFAVGYNESESQSELA